MTEAYDFAADTAEKLGFRVMRTEDLDGYFKEHGTGPEIEPGTLYTNPWTEENPSPLNYIVPSPATLPASDHGMFMNTPYDTWENLNKYFPGRAEAHFAICSPLLSALLLAE